MRRVRSARTSYEVGKGRTPKETRFKPGESGNPSGRPKGAKNVATLAKAELTRKVTATINGAKRRMSVAEISCRRLSEKAMSGDHKALSFLIMLASDVNPAEAADVASLSTTPEQDMAIIAEFVKNHKPNEAK
jgi:hypothetical protein